MARIIALQGVSNTGKTTTLKLLSSLIQAKYPKAIETVLRDNTLDILVLIEPVHGLKIGIESRGDSGAVLSPGLKRLKAHGCDVIFCACRTRGSTIEAIENLCPPYSSTYMPKSFGTSHARLNNQDALMLMQFAGI